jgi:hypothetical protein
MTLGCNTTIKIKSGNYAGITIQNINAASGCRITITNDGGAVVLSGTRTEMNLSNLNGVTITGDISNGNAKGFQFKDNSYRAIIFQNKINNVTISNMSFSNVTDYVISYMNNTVYTGAGTSADNIKILKMDVVRSGRFIHFEPTRGGSQNGNFVGVFKNLEIANVNYSEAPRGENIIWVVNAVDFNIHHNKITNVNSAISNHSGLFHIQGNGRFHNNFISNHHGNAIRAWIYSIGTTPKEMLIYNNIVIDGRKYSAFEIQTMNHHIIAGKSTYANAKVFNNTVGNLNTTKDSFAGTILDVYTTKGGAVEVFNNLGYNFPVRSYHSDIWNPLGGSQVKGYNNLYVSNASAAGLVDQQQFKLNGTSPAKNKGAATNLITTDYHGNRRNAANPSIGAVE